MQDEIDVKELGPKFEAGELVYIVKLMRRVGGYFWCLAEEAPRVSRGEDGELIVKNLFLINDIAGYDTVPAIDWRGIDDLSYRPVRVIKQKRASAAQRHAIVNAYKTRSR